MKSERNHQRAEIRRDAEKERKIKNGGEGVGAIIEGKNYESIEAKVAIAVATDFVVLIVGAMAQG